MRQVVQAANGDDRSINLDFHPEKNLQDNLYNIRCTIFVTKKCFFV